MDSRTKERTKSFLAILALAIKGPDAARGSALGGAVSYLKSLFADDVSDEYRKVLSDL